MSGDDAHQGTAAGPQAPACSKCRGVTAFVAAISRTTLNPAFRIYHCIVCNQLEWVEEPAREQR